MRQVIDSFLYLNKDAILLVADFGKFPLMETTDRYFNVGLSETLLVNIATGLALTNKHIFIYSAANFVLYRAYELIKLHINDTNKLLNITFLNGGAGFCYAECGRGHYLIDDINMLTTNFNKIQILLPYDKITTIKCLKQSFKGLNYIRLCFDDAIDFKTDKKHSGQIYTFGWLTLYISDIVVKNKLDVNILPIIRLSNLKYIDSNDKIIYDNIHCNLIDKYFKNENIKCIDVYFDKTGCNRNKVLKYFKFDEQSIVDFIKR